MRLGELLVSAKLITQSELSLANSRLQNEGGTLGAKLVELGLLTEAALAGALSTLLHLPLVSAPMMERVPREAFAKLSAGLAERHRVCPVRVDGKRLWLAMSDPTDAKAQKEIADATGFEVRAMVAPESMIGTALANYFGLAHQRPALSIPPPTGLDLQLDGIEERTAPLPSLPPPRTAKKTVPGFAPSFPDDDPPADAPTFPDLYAPRPNATLPPGLPSLVPRRAGPPELAVGPITARRMTIADLARRLATATSESAAVDATLEMVVQEFARAAMVMVSGFRLVGHRGAGEGLNSVALRSFAAERDAIPAFGKAFADPRPTYGPAAPAAIGGLANALAPPAGAPLLLLPIRRGDEPVGCIVAVGGRPGAESWLDDWASAARKLGLALQMFALRDLILAD